MSLIISSVKEPGNLSKERVVLKAVADCDVGKYLLILTEKNEKGTRGGDVADAYWFPDKTIREGDLVVVYSKSGLISEKGSSGRTSHFFYLNRSDPHFTGKEMVAVVGLFSGWKSSGPDLDDFDDEI